MMNKNLAPAAVLIAAITVTLSTGCADQGAVKPEAAPGPAAASKPASAQDSAPVATPGSAPPLVSRRGDGTAALPPGHPPIDAGAAPAPSLPPVPEGAGVGETALTWTVPTGWIVEEPASSLRRAQYKVPGKAGDGECVVFYFGPGQGGDPIANAQRWADQFTTADGGPATTAMKTSTVEVGALKVFLVEVSGTYKGGMTMTAAPAVAKPGYRLLGAVAPGPDANWYFKFTGPDGTVNAQREAFNAMVRSMKHGAS